MKTKNFKKPIALFLAVMLCASLLFSLGTTASPQKKPPMYALLLFHVTGMRTTMGNGGMAI